MILNYRDLYHYYWYSSDKDIGMTYQRWLKTQGAIIKTLEDEPSRPWSLEQRLVIDISEEDLLILKLKFDRILK